MYLIFNLLHVFVLLRESLSNVVPSLLSFYLGQGALVINDWILLCCTKAAVFLLVPRVLRTEKGVCSRSRVELQRWYLNRFAQNIIVLIYRRTYNWDFFSRSFPLLLRACPGSRFGSDLSGLELLALTHIVGLGIEAEFWHALGRVHISTEHGML